MPVIYEPKGRAREYAALACNLYKGCTHGCKYCYAPNATRTNRKTFHEKALERKNIIKQLTSDAKRSDRNTRVMFCFTSDPYHTGDTSITRQALQVLKIHNIPFQVLTKGGTRATRDIDLFDHRDCFASTLTFTPEKTSLSEEWEPNAANPDDRYQALKDFHNVGIFTWASLEPVLDPDQSIEIIMQTREFVDLFKVGTLNHHPLAKTIDWRSFAIDAVETLESISHKYYIKHDLRKHLPASLRGFGMCSTDNAPIIETESQVMFPGF